MVVIHHHLMLFHIMELVVEVLLHKELIQVEAQLDLVVLEQLQLSQDLQQLMLVEVEVVVMQVQHQVQLHQIHDLVELVVAEMELLAL